MRAADEKLIINESGPYLHRYTFIVFCSFDAIAMRKQTILMNSSA